jgi:two-component system, cell cycle sensor histidine kinase PleC
MARLFAASEEALRKSGARDARQGTIRLDQFHRTIPDRLLDRTIPALIFIFLTIAAISTVLQFTSTRLTALAQSEANLSIVAALISSELQRETESQPDIVALIARLPHGALEGQRKILIENSQGLVEIAIGEGGVTGRPFASYFAEPLPLRQSAKSVKIHRIQLASGKMASLATREAGPHFARVHLVQTLDDELVSWQRHASVIGVILLSFGAVTIAFCGAYYAQRTRTRDAGRNFTLMRERFETVLDRGRCGLWDWDLQSGTVLWSGSMFHLLNLPESDLALSYCDILNRLHPEDTAPLHRVEQAIAAGNGEIDHLFRMKNRDNAWIWLRMRAILIDEAMQPMSRLLGIIMDVTEEKTSELERHRADARLRDAVESISEAFVLWDNENKLILCNSKYQSFHGVPPELTIRGMRYDAFMALANPPRILVEIDRGSLENAQGCAYEAQLKDGRWLLISERPTKDGGFVSVGTDITSRKQQENDLMENERRLRQTITDLGASRETLRLQTIQLSELADRYLEQKAEVISANRVKAEFLANMNHEIRTPLNHIIGFAEMIDSEIFGPVGSPRYLEYATNIHESGKSLLALISDVLDMARIEAGRVMVQRSQTTLGHVLDLAVFSIEDDAEEKSLTLNISPSLLDSCAAKSIYVDPIAVSEALAHLLRNAIRLSPCGGQLSMRARVMGDYVNIFIADGGCPLAAHDINAMENPFGHIDGMLHDGCKGSGLGVAIARSLIELHGGHVRLRSTQTVGALVMVHLPISFCPIQLSLPIG